MNLTNSIPKFRDMVNTKLKWYPVLQMHKVNDILKICSPSTASAICKLFNKFIMRSWHYNTSSSVPYQSLHAKHQTITVSVSQSQSCKSHFTCWIDVCWERFWRCGMRSDAGRFLLLVSLGDWPTGWVHDKSIWKHKTKNEYKCHTSNIHEYISIS